MARLRALAEVLRWGAGTWLLWRVPGAKPPCDGGGAEPSGTERMGTERPVTVSVVVPARNEEARLPALLRSLAAQSRPPEEVLVVDDASSDATALVAGAMGAAVIAPGELPAGWTGKAWACAAGARAASSSVLVFLDADTWLLADGIERLLAEHARQGGLGIVTVAPFHRVQRPYERLSAMCNLVTMMGTGAFTPRGGWAASVGSFGPCVVCSRTVYEALGGHGAIRGGILDDLCGLFRAAGRPVRMLGGRGSVEYRMYPDGLAELGGGWAKNLASGAAMTRPVVLALVVAWVSGLLAAPWRLGRTAAGRAAAGRGGGWSLGTYVAYGLQVEWMLRRIGSFGRGTGVIYPAPLGAFLACFVASLRRTLGPGQVRWKGRRVDLGASSGHTGSAGSAGSTGGAGAGGSTRPAGEAGAPACAAGSPGAAGS